MSDKHRSELNLTAEETKKKKFNNDKVTKKEIKQLLKTGEKKTNKREKISTIFTSLFRKLRFTKFRKRNKKIISHKARS